MVIKIKWKYDVVPRCELIPEVARFAEGVFVAQTVPGMPADHSSECFRVTRRRGVLIRYDFESIAHM